MLQLFFEKTEASDSVVPVRWCIDADMAREIKEKKAKGYKTFAVLFCIQNVQNQKESRVIASLDEMMAFIPFTGPGENLVRAIAVCSRNNIKAVRHDFLEKSTRPFRSFAYVIMFYGDLPLDCERVDRHIGSIRCDFVSEQNIIDISINVPKELFGKKGPEWLWKWSNLLFKNEPVDECSYRKRKYFLAFTIQPFIILIWAIFNTFCKILLASILLLLGMRGIGLKALLHPLGRIEDVEGYVQWPNSFFWFSEFDRYDHSGRGRKMRHPALWPFTPIFPTITITAIIILGLQKVFFSLGTILLIVVGVPVIASLSILLLALLLTVIHLGVTRLASHELKERDKEKAEILAEKQLIKIREKREREAEELEEKLRAITCIGVPLTPRLNALPKEARTIKLRFLDLKAKVCRPFAE